MVELADTLDSKSNAHKAYRFDPGRRYAIAKPSDVPPWQQQDEIRVWGLDQIFAVEQAGEWHPKHVLGSIVSWRSG